MLDDLAGLWRDPVREEHLELHHQVAPLGWALWQGQTFAPQSADGSWLDDVAARQRHHPVVKCWDVNSAAAEGLEAKKRETESRLNEVCRPAIFGTCFVRVYEWPD